LEAKMPKAILYDATLCVGCKACEEACAQRAGLSYSDAIAAETRTSAHKLTAVLERGGAYMRRLCMHCEDPTCVSVCPVGAFRKTDAGPVVYDEGRCMGCRYCMLACPFGVPKYEWTRTDPRVRKCDMCADRIAEGKATMCSEVCPTGATKCGDRDALIDEAAERLRSNPGQYVKRIYGAREAGGTSVLILSGKPLEEFGLRADIRQEPLPILTYQVLSRIPDLVGLGSVLLGGIWWLSRRRAEVAAAEGRERADGSGEGGRS
jgi:formate dehydrogenase iron-sulfur subunit